ncbi:hypothetical protein BofuT4_P097800.1 [Botrytis cinerea T4]|uniref:Uncharacterized protein n=1 Tax=Botryotinia fuckeliana (strain T4) TaxID=999810 RepID=G2YCQ0_BOTF4|nr:hypothetical protein BofuT4_P097800.1 [Botrytis cinerea T4]
MAVCERKGQLETRSMAVPAKVQYRRAVDTRDAVDTLLCAEKTNKTSDHTASTACFPRESSVRLVLNAQDTATYCITNDRANASCECLGSPYIHPGVAAGAEDKKP